MKLSVTQAQLAVLRNDDAIYQASLKQASSTIENYFLTSDATTRNLLDNLKQAREVTLASNISELNNTVNLLQTIMQEK